MPSTSLARIHCFWFALACLISFASAAQAQLFVPDASFHLNCNGAVQDSPLPAELTCNTPFARVGPPTWEGTEIGFAEAYAGVPEFDPHIPLEVRQKLETELGLERLILLSAVQVETTVTNTNPDPESVLTHSTSVGASASLDFAVGVEELFEPPFPLDEVPVKIRIVGEARVEGGINGLATLLAQGGLGVLRWEQIGPGSISVNEEINTEFFRVGDEIHLFSKVAQCQATTAEVPGWIGGATASGSCTAVVDPIFELDQARFDVLAGANTFPLDEYFALRYSPNLPIPPPIAVPLFSHVLGPVLLCTSLLGISWKRIRAHA